MLKIENLRVDGFLEAIRGMRNPMNSWAKSDSTSTAIGEKDMELALKLCKAGSEHSKFRRMIICYADITAPRYWWTEFDTYKVGTVANSCSTMHKIHTKEFTLDDFSVEHLSGYPLHIMQGVIDRLNFARLDYVESKDKAYWWELIQLLPQSYNQRRTVMLNYEVLAKMYRERKGHKLDEWHTFCDTIATLPCAQLITLKEAES